MNRKDTILVAVLINAGVLVVLFTSALKNKHSDHLIKEPEISTTLETKLEPVSIMKDEIDLAIENAKKLEIARQEEPKVPQELILEQSQSELVINEPVISHQSHASSMIDVTVKKGDFLAKIAKRHNVTVEEIMKINNLKNTNLRIGQVLKVPQTIAVQAPTEPAIKQEAASSSKVYTMKPGDNPWTIAQKHKMKVDELLKLNNLTPEKAKHLKVGDKLKVK
jgi:peptidoglycan DL-endopeptidase LytF